MCTSKANGGRRCDGHGRKSRAVRELVTSMVPRRNPAQVAYWEATDSKHFGDPSTPGSTFTDPSLKCVEDVVALAYTQRGGLAGDDREKFIARGASPDAFMPGNRYLLVSTPGTCGVTNTSEMDPDTILDVVRTKPGAPCSLVVAVDEKPETDYGVIIVTRDTAGQTDHGGDMVITAFPGTVTAPVADERVDAREGTTVTVEWVRKTLGTEAWVNTRLRST